MTGRWQAWATGTMADQRVTLTPTYILHRKPYRDTSLLLEAFAAEYGRIGLVARGARSAKSSVKGLLQPFQPLLLSWSGRGELRTLIAAEAGGRPAFFQGAALAAGFYLNELMLRLLARHDPHPELFEAYDRTVGALARSPAEWSLRLFERDLLQALGYGLLLTHTADDGEPVRPDAHYCYHLESGPVAVGSTGGGLPIKGTTLLALGSGGPEPAAAGLIEAKQLMRAALRIYLGDRPLASRSLFRHLAGTAGHPSDTRQKEEH